MQDGELQYFATLSDALAQPGEPAGPRNRLRDVRRLWVRGKRYYLKHFHATQWKNRLHFARTRPYARTDAEREAGVARELTARGLDAPRVLAVGRNGEASYFLCAELRGEPVVNRLGRGAFDNDLVRRAAEYCAEVARRGVWLPDLSADHLFVRFQRDGQPRFAVLDLHNGRVDYCPTLRDHVRQLRRWQKSVRGLSLRKATAFRFAIQLLRKSGRSPADIRRVLGALPPIETHSRYDAGDKAKVYRQRNPKRTAAELACLKAAWPGRPGDLVVDCPSGAGRLVPTLRTELGAQVLGMDRSLAMLREQSGTSAADLRVHADATRLPLGEHSVDGALVFRFLHHLPPDRARAVLHEAARTARRFVVVSFFHPLSPHAIRRRTRRALTRRAQTRFAHWPRQIERWLGEVGLEPMAWAPERRYLREFWVASFVRRDPDRATVHNTATQTFAGREPNDSGQRRASRDPRGTA